MLLAWPRHDPLAAGGRRPGTGKKGEARGVHRVGGIQGRSEQSKGNKTVALVGFFIQDLKLSADALAKIV